MPPPGDSCQVPGRQHTPDVMAKNDRRRAHPPLRTTFSNRRGLTAGSTPGERRLAATASATPMLGNPTSEGWKSSSGTVKRSLFSTCEGRQSPPEACCLTDLSCLGTQLIDLKKQQPSGKEKGRVGGYPHPTHLLIRFLGYMDIPGLGPSGSLVYPPIPPAPGAIGPPCPTTFFQTTDIRRHDGSGWASPAARTAGGTACGWGSSRWARRSSGGHARNPSTRSTSAPQTGRPASPGEGGHVDADVRSKEKR